jgi:hypothetical protein
MASVTPFRTDPVTKVHLEMRSTGTDDSDSAYDSDLLLHKNGCDNHTLTLVLKIFLNPFDGLRVPYLGRVWTDANGKLFQLKAWTPGEFAEFTRKFKVQAALWNNRFWLIPPKAFDKLNIKVGARTLQPNIYCHLYIDLVANRRDAHHSIDVVNLDTKAIAAQRGVREGDLTSGTFRSQDNLYDSLDVKPRDVTNMKDSTGATPPLKHYTITHEIGHALGLPHIGVTHNDPLCKLAMFLDQLAPGSTTVPALFQNGSNARVCYGYWAPPGRAANIMGGGSKFEASNAQPWVDRIALHTATTASAWTVSVERRVAPR